MAAEDSDVASWTWAVWLNPQPTQTSSHMIISPWEHARRYACERETEMWSWSEPVVGFSPDLFHWTGRTEMLPFSIWSVSSFSIDSRGWKPRSRVSTKSPAFSSKTERFPLIVAILNLQTTNLLCSDHMALNRYDLGTVRAGVFSLSLPDQSIHFSLRYITPIHPQLLLRRYVQSYCLTSTTVGISFLRIYLGR